MAGTEDPPVLREAYVLLQQIKRKVASGEITIQQLRAWASSKPAGGSAKNGYAHRRSSG